VPTLHGISHEHYAMHATQLFLTGQVYPMLMLNVLRVSRPYKI